MKFLKPIVSEVPQGTAPLQIESTTLNQNLNAAEHSQYRD